tara:strand:- start:19465 stop:20253 length:789 start_codon:yes stop_codon:yes gene_type:complete
MINTNNYAESYAAFLKKKEMHYEKYNAIINGEDGDDSFKSLVDDGFVLVKDFIKENQLLKINNELKSKVIHLYECNENEHRVKYVNREFGVARLMHADTLSSAANKLFFNNEFINSLAKKIVSEKVISYQRMIEYRTGPGLVSGADNWHFDDWKHRFKAFLYLTDVDELSCPFVCIKGTHKYVSEEWRLRKEFEYDFYGKNGSYGYFQQHEIDNLSKRYKWKPQVFTAKAGTLIMVDTRILHKGTPSKGKERFLLANYFDVR